jgi:ferredoxin-NADP reductase
MPDSEVAAERSSTDRTPNPQPPAHDHWQQATLISTRRQSKHSRTLTLRVPGWSGHLPGQHVDVRLTAEDGYTAQRSFSLAEPSSNGRLAITVDLVPHGEVSPYLVGAMEIGDQLDVRGPIGGWFVWQPGSPQPTGEPILLIAGGSGVVPLVTMLRARNKALDPTRMLLVYSLRDPEDLMYAHDLEGLQAHEGQASPGTDGVEARLVYTRHAPPGSPRSVGHLTAADLHLPGAWDAALASRVYLCGSSGFVEHATNLLHAVGYSDQHIRIERFGPSGVES